MIRCLLVDNEPLALDALENLLQKVPGMEVSGRCEDAVLALDLLHKRHFHLMFLDIEMPELTGLEMLRTLSHPPAVIFTTAYREYAADAFELNVIDYLIKPISLERLVKAINRFHERRSAGEMAATPEKGSTRSYLKVYADKKTHRIDTADILFVEGLKDYAMIHTRKDRLLTRQTMKKMETALTGEGFCRIHRSFIVPLSRLDGWTTYSVSIEGKEIPIGKTYRKAVLDQLEGKVT